MFSFLTSRAGQLSADEFLHCGDALTDASTTWRWCAAAPSSLTCKHLPFEKQFLRANGLSVCAASATATHEDGAPFTLIDSGNDEVGGGGGGGGGGAGAAALEPQPPAVIDMSILYDTWWRVPHAYFSSPTLSPQQVLALASADMTTTATLAKHPLAEGLCVSLHPCKVASVLATFPDKTLALVVFLKVVQHALPGLALDATWGV